MFKSSRNVYRRYAAIIYFNKRYVSTDFDICESVLELCIYTERLFPSIIFSCYFWCGVGSPNTSSSLEQVD